MKIDSDEASGQDATKGKGSASAASEETRRLLSEAKESQRAAGDTVTDLNALKAENAELRSRLERLEALFNNANFKRDMMTQQRTSGPRPR